MRFNVPLTVATASGYNISAGHVGYEYILKISIFGGEFPFVIVVKFQYNSYWGQYGGGLRYIGLTQK